MQVDATEIKVRKIIKNSTGIEEVIDFDVTRDMQDLGINSIAFIKMVVSLEKEFKVTFEENDLDETNFKSLKHIVDFISTKSMQ